MGLVSSSDFFLNQIFWGAPGDDFWSNSYSSFNFLLCLALSFCISVYEQLLIGFFFFLFFFLFLAFAGGRGTPLFREWVSPSPLHLPPLPDTTKGRHREFSGYSHLRRPLDPSGLVLSKHTWVRNLETSISRFVGDLARPGSASLHTTQRRHEEFSGYSHLRRPLDPSGLVLSKHTWFRILASSISRFVGDLARPGSLSPHTTHQLILDFLRHRIMRCLRELSGMVPLNCTWFRNLVSGASPQALIYEKFSLGLRPKICSARPGFWGSAPDPA